MKYFPRVQLVAPPTIEIGANHHTLLVDTLESD